VADELILEELEVGYHGTLPGGSIFYAGVLDWAGCDRPKMTHRTIDGGHRGRR